MRIRKLTFLSGGERRAGILHECSNRACIITSHGLFSSKDSRKYVELAEIACQESISVFRFDYKGCGESNGDIRDATIACRVNDLLTAVKMMREMGFSRVGVIGSSLGSFISIVAASRSNVIDALVCMSTLVSPRKILTMLSQRYSSATSFLSDVDEYDVIDVARDVRCPVMFIHGELDDLTPFDEVYKLYYSVSSKIKAVSLIRGADHVFSNQLHRGISLRMAVDWFKRHLLQD